MSIGKLKARADELSREALLERSRCRAGIRNASAIVRRRVGSPAGLAISFSLGFIAGLRRSRDAGANRGGGATRAREEVVGTVVNSAVKLLIAIVANSLVRQPAAAPEDEDQPSRGVPA